MRDRASELRLRIYLTGASGYVGRALARRLTSEGHEVRALVRPTSRVEPLREAGVATFSGDITVRASMREGMSGADWVIHAAADLDLTGPAGRMEQVNVEGSENVASLAWKLGVPRFLSVSSVAYFGGSPADGSAATEETLPSTPFPTRYSATKHQGEKIVRAYAARGLSVVTVYPSLVYGPPGKRDGANALLRQLWRGRFPVLLGADKKTSWIYLDDLVDGMLRALARAEPGSAWLMTGEVATVREVTQKVAALGGAPAPRRELSLATARRLLQLSRPLFALLGRRPPMPLAQLSSLERHWAFDDRRARDAFAWTPRGLDAGLPPTLAEFEPRA